MVLVMSSVSIMPAERVTISSCQGNEVSTIENVVDESSIAPEADTLSPFHVVTVPPKRSIAIVSLIV